MLPTNDTPEPNRALAIVAEQLEEGIAAEKCHRCV
jgi:hypothetical protein